MYFGQIIVKSTQFDQNWVLFFRKWYTDGWEIWQKIGIEIVRFSRSGRHITYDLVKEPPGFTMNILQIDDQFLTDDVDTWSQSQAYQSSLGNILAVNVVNNSAECGVKLSSDFLAAAHSEKHYQNVLQVVEQDRKKKESQSWKKA